MKFINKIYKKPEESTILAAGEYNFKIIKADEKLSKSGNEMIELYIAINPNGSPYGRCNDWILDKENLVWKRKHLLESIGKSSIYDKHELNSQDLIGGEGICIITRQKDDNGKEFNRIKDYLPSNSKKTTEFNDDKDIPF